MSASITQQPRELEAKKPTPATLHDASLALHRLLRRAEDAVGGAKRPLFCSQAQSQVAARGQVESCYIYRCQSTPKTSPALNERRTWRRDHSGIPPVHANSSSSAHCGGSTRAMLATLGNRQAQRNGLFLLHRRARPASGRAAGCCKL